MNTRNTLFIENGCLHIGGFEATQLVQKFGTPLYVMDGEYLREVALAYVKSINEYGSGAVAYASKAFLSIATSKILSKCGLWFDSVSGGEVYALYKAGVDMSHVMFHGNNKTPNEIELAIDHKLGYFVIDSYDEIENINKIAGQKNVVQKVLIRVNPCVSAHTFAAVQTAAPQSKFGFEIEKEALKVVKLIMSKPNLKFEGLHIHIGSQIYEHSAYDLAIEKILNLVKVLKEENISINILDLGGGYGIYYTDEDPKFTPNRYGYILKNICDKVKELCKKMSLDLPFLVVEPGRSIVGEAGITLYTVGTIKDFSPIKKYVAVDGGMFENPRYALYDAKYSATICEKASLPQTDKVTIVGKCCESGDIIAADIPLQKAEVGDTVAVFSTGAYNYSMASNYNFNAIPPVVLVDGTKADYIVKPQTYEDLLRNNVVPEWLNEWRID